MEKGQKDILTVRDVQDEYGIAKNTAYDFVNQKGFPAIRFGKTIRIPRKALEQWLAKQFESTEN
jgi:excisionase family DNA binding protein